MKALIVEILVLLCLVPTFSITIPKVRATEPYVEIHPTEGTIYTNIFLRVSGLDKFFANDFAPVTIASFLYLYWDGFPVIVALGDNTTGAQTSIYDTYHNHWFETWFRIPNVYPYTELGNHSIYIEVYREGHIMINFTTSFQITQYFPPTQEWLEWWASLSSDIKQQLIGPHGAQGIQGSKGDTGPQGTQGIRGEKGDSYLGEVVVLGTVSMIAMVLSSLALMKSNKYKNRES